MTLHRFYCFFDEQLAKYQVHVYRRLLGQRLKKKKELTLPIETHSFAEMREFLEETLSKELQKLENDFFFNKFWEWANPQQKAQLLLSIYLRTKNPKGVFNIEIDNWLEEGPFSDFYHESKRLFSSWRPREILARIITTSGNHKKSIRLGNIHLALDKVDGRDVYSIHYDKYNPNQLRKLGLIKHFLFEDRKQKKLF